MRTVSRGSPVDRRWSVPGMILSQLRHGDGHAPKDSPLTLQDVLASEDYRDLCTAKVAEGDLAPDFELAAARTAPAPSSSARSSRSSPSRSSSARTPDRRFAPRLGRSSSSRALRRPRALPLRLHPRGAPGGRLDPPREPPLRPRRSTTRRRTRSAARSPDLRRRPADEHADRRSTDRQRRRLGLRRLAGPPVPDRLATAASPSRAARARSASSRTSSSGRSSASWHRQRLVAQLRAGVDYRPAAHKSLIISAFSGLEGETLLNCGA